MTETEIEKAARAAWERAPDQRAAAAWEAAWRAQGMQGGGCAGDECERCNTVAAECERIVAALAAEASAND